MIAWPDGVTQKVSRSTNWNLPLGVITEKTRSGKSKTRAGHTFEPIRFSVEFNMTLDEYRIFENWYMNIDRMGVFTFGFPKINDNSEEIQEYLIVSAPSLTNVSGDYVEVKMNWEQVN
jgi:hypothetical protein